MVISLAIGPALAHGSAPADWGLWGHWSFDPLTITLLVAAQWLYGRGVLGVRRRLGRAAGGLDRRHVASFVAGQALLVLALVSPLEALADATLSVHMVQHVILVTLAPPLLILGRPEAAWLHGLPRSWRRPIAAGRVRRALSVMAPLGRPIPAALLHAAALWVWHAPALFDAALERDWLHWLEHACFFGTALVFWRAVVRAAQARSLAPAGMAACLLILVQGGFLGALLTFAGHPLYQVPDSGLLGLTPLEDQQLAGLIMWVPMGLAYMVAGLAVGARLLDAAEPRLGATVAIPAPPGHARPDAGGPLP